MTTSQTGPAAASAGHTSGGAGIPPRLALGGAALAVALAAILSALAFEHLGGFVPCALCLEQRTPYYVAIPLLAAALAVLRPSPALSRVLFVAAAGALVWSAGLGGYQAGAEWGFWEGPADCGGADAVARDASALLAQLAETRLVSCTEAGARFAGLSFAGWNVVAAGGAALLALAAAVLPHRVRRGR